MALGQEENTYKVNEPGKYYDPASGKYETVTMHAGADALVRLGWERVGDVEEDQIKDPYGEAAKAENAKAEAAKGSK